MGFPTDFFPILFAIPRTVGWLSHWNEFQNDPDFRIVRPFQVYKGHGMKEARKYEDIATRPQKNMETIESTRSAESRRRNAV
jgi:citrate synthase